MSILIKQNDIKELTDKENPKKIKDSTLNYAL